MNLVRFIAKRYLFSKKNTNAINIISAISVLIFTVGTAVMIIILSFLNGLEGLVKGMDDSFDPDIKIEAKYAKTFNADSVLQLVNVVEGVLEVSKTLEDNVVVRYGDAQEIAKIKGVDAAFKSVTNVDTFIVYGDYKLEKDGNQFAVFGAAISTSININLESIQTKATLFVPKKGVEFNQLNPDASLNLQYVIPAGVVVLNEDGDKDLIIASLELVQSLFEVPGRVSGLELSVKEGEEKAVLKALKVSLGESYSIRTRSEQNEAAYKVFKTEKWATFAILVLVVLIAAFNTIGALTMLVLEKKKDIQILRSMGAPSKTIRNIFLNEGMLITWVGIILGLMLGVSFIWIQDVYGIVPLEGSFVEYFPVVLNPLDLLGVVVVISVLGLLASVYPSVKAGENA
ncbi:MAG: lipoprotein-releasing system permease protein [bacterium]|jgi:lipoprotein-releasing system permease protein